MKKECCDLNEVIQEFYNYVKAYVFNKTKDKQLSEDIIQEVMFKLVESHQKSVDVKNVKAWLFQITRNTLYDYFNKNRIAIDFDKDLQTAGPSTEKEPLIQIEDYIVPMIALLPNDYALPLKMSDLDNIPQKEIAKQLNLGLSATKMRIQRARVKLRELFVECCHIEYDKNGAIVSCSIKNSCDPLLEISKKLHKKI